MNKRLFIAAILVIFGLTQLTGCWSRKELNRLSIIMAAAVDPGVEPDKIVFTVQIVNAASIKNDTNTTGNAGKPFYTVSSSGLTLADAERHLYKLVDRPLFWQHARAIIVSEKLVRTNPAAMLDYLERNPAFRRNMLLLVTSGPARDALKTPFPAEKNFGRAIYNLATEAVHHSEAYYPSTINDFLITMSTPGIEPVLAHLEVLSVGNGSAPDNSAATTPLELSGGAVFKGGLMIGWLNADETQGLLWAQGKAQKLPLILKYPGSRDKKELLTILNQRSKCTIKPEFSAAKPRITIAIKAEGRTSGVSFTDKDFTQPAIIKALDHQYTLAIKRKVRLVLAKAQGEYRSDIFGFGLAISRKYPRLWKKLGPNWDSDFSHLKVNLKVTGNIRRIGLTTKPVTSE